jgi:hypothetical protein
MTTKTTGSAAPSGHPFTDGVVHGTPKLLLRMEGAAALAVATYAYAQFGNGWGLFAMLFLVPDLSMLGYLANPRIGAVTYNFGHSYLSPAALAFAGLVTGMPMLFSVALIWIAHIGFDRAVGYGFKYPTAFKHTHLGLPFSKPTPV